MIGKAGRGAGSPRLTLSGAGGPRERFMEGEGRGGVDAEGQGPEANRPFVIGRFAEAHVFAGEGRREKASRRPPVDGAAAGHAPQLDIGGILEQWESAGERARGRRVVGRGRRIPQGFVRPPVVERASPALEALMLQL